MDCSTTISSAVYNPKTKMFENIAMMKQARAYATCSVFGGGIVVSGGLNNNGPDLNTVEIYDHCSNEWSRLPDMIEKRRNHASVSIKNKLYMIGGRDM